LIHSDAIISLTHKAKSIILNWNLGINDAKITVIPCCADLDHFSQKNVETEKLNLLQSKFPQLKHKFILSYVGSLGTWYMADEMLDFFNVLSKKMDAVFLIITKDHKSLVYKAAKKHNVDIEKLIIVSANREEMPYYISFSDVSLFFIKPSFSKSASSPTKMGELLSMGVPVITNTGVGDVNAIITESACGISISDFNQNEYQKAILDFQKNSNLYKKNTVNAANQYFSLNHGIDQYFKVYHSFTK